MVGKDGPVMSLQDGVFRTNCIDCLDRTNVVQSLLARRNLQEQFQVSPLTCLCSSIRTLRAIPFSKVTRGGPENYS